jgi:hypothetical protein
MHFNRENSINIIGSELSVRFSPSENISLLASWTYRGVFDHDTGKSFDDSPKHLITLGGRFRLEWGLIGSLYLFTRSEFTDHAVQNPAGIMEPMLGEHLENQMLVLGRIGWRHLLSGNSTLEAGIKIFLPVSPFSEPRFQFREDGGGIDPSGKNYGGDLLCRMVSLYLQGSF